MQRHDFEASASAALVPKPQFQSFKVSKAKEFLLAAEKKVLALICI